MAEHSHISSEQYDLFPAAALALGPGEWDEVDAAAADARRRVAVER
jgi:hypothetical protein